MAKTLELPIIDLDSSDRISTARAIRQACMDCGFFYLVNHGVEENLLQNVLERNKTFFNLPLEEKMKLARKEHRGYTPLYAEKLDPSSNSRGDSKESFYIGRLEDETSSVYLNQWPSEEILPSWRSTMEDYYKKVLVAGERLVSLIALALNLEENFFHDVGAFNPPSALLRLLHYPGVKRKVFACVTEDEYKDLRCNKHHLVGVSIYSTEFPLNIIALALNLEENFFHDVSAFNPPSAFLRLLHYPGELGSSNEETYGASAHSDYGMITLLATDGVGGLQVCREKSKKPRLWEDVQHISGAFIVNIGDMMERWTNCLFRSTLHRVMTRGQERYSVAFFLDPSPDCVVECLKSCCSESSPPRYAPIRSGDYLQERLRLTYGL